MTRQEEIELRVTAGLLQQGKKLDAISNVLTLITIVVLLHYAHVSISLALAAIVTGLAQKYVAVRVAFDATLLRDCADKEISTAELDEVMLALKLLPKAKTERPWALRCRGARRLLRIQTTLLVVQTPLATLATLARY